MGLRDASSTEFNLETFAPVIALVSQWVDRDGQIEQRSQTSDLGGTMRLGAQACQLRADSRARQIYGTDRIQERHRHRYEVNNHYVARLEAAGMVISSRSVDDQLVEMIELPDHPWFVASQFHPEFTSTPRRGHPLFTGFVNAAIDKRLEITHRIRDDATETALKSELINLYF